MCTFMVIQFNQCMEADRLAKVGVQQSRVQVVGRKRTTSVHRLTKQKTCTGRGIKSTVCVQVLDSEIGTGGRQTRSREKRKQQGPLELPDPELD